MFPPGIHMCCSRCGCLERQFLPKFRVPVHSFLKLSSSTLRKQSTLRRKGVYMVPSTIEAPYPTRSIQWGQINIFWIQWRISQQLMRLSDGVCAHVGRHSCILRYIWGSRQLLKVPLLRIVTPQCASRCSISAYIFKPSWFPWGKRTRNYHHIPSLCNSSIYPCQRITSQFPHLPPWIVWSKITYPRGQPHSAASTLTMMLLLFRHEQGRPQSRTPNWGVLWPILSPFSLKVQDLQYLQSMLGFFAQCTDFNTSLLPPFQY